MLQETLGAKQWKNIHVGAIRLIWKHFTSFLVQSWSYQPESRELETRHAKSSFTWQTLNCFTGKTLPENVQVLWRIEMLSEVSE